jgi:hypothetical protein
LSSPPPAEFRFQQSDRRRHRRSKAGSDNYFHLSFTNRLYHFVLSFLLKQLMKNFNFFQLIIFFLLFNPIFISERLIDKFFLVIIHFIGWRNFSVLHQCD